MVGQGAPFEVMCKFYKTVLSLFCRSQESEIHVGLLPQGCPVTQVINISVLLFESDSALLFIVSGFVYV